MAFYGWNDVDGNVLSTSNPYSFAVGSSDIVVVLDAETAG